MISKSTGSQGAKPSFSMDDFAKALEQHDYDFQKGQIVRGKVFSHETEGAYVDIGGKSLAFVPRAEIYLGPDVTLADVLPLNEEQEFLIIRDQNADGQVTLSLKQLTVRRAWDTIEQLQESGQSFQVRVTGVNKGGVTVEINGLRGFIPRSHVLGRDNLDSLVDQSIMVNFLEVDQERNKLVLSQRLASQAASFNQLEIGQLVEGKVSNIKPFGVFIDLDGVTGLLHIKQVSQRPLDDISTVFTPGQILKAMVVELEEGRNRISLSTKVLENYPGEVIDRLTDVMESAEARAERARKGVLQGLS